MDSEKQKVLLGRTSRAEPERSNLVRVFICSTFTDMSSERRVLWETSYTEIQTFCQDLGLLLEVVDLRYGLRAAPGADHMEGELSLQEVDACWRRSVCPTFVALLGNRYGHRVLPRLIPEKHFQILLSKLSGNADGLKLLRQWFLKDSNVVPPCYVLQPITAHFPDYSDLRPEIAAQREESALSWRLTETKLLQLLRCAAKQAEADGELTTQQKEGFSRSVTECEIQAGLLREDEQPPGLVFIREVPHQKVREGPRRLARFLDVTADGLLDNEAQTMLTALKSRLYSSCKNILNLNCVELSRGTIDPKRKEHAQYLESLRQQFVSQIKARISRLVDLPVEGRRRKVWGDEEVRSDWLLEEVSRHSALAAQLGRKFHGRESMLGRLCLSLWESSTAHHTPLVVHGAAGMGKTALLCKLAQEMLNVLEPRAVVVVRLLSAVHPVCPEIDHTLQSVCLQVCLACGLKPPDPLTANTHLELVRFFQNLLATVSQQGDSLLIILDGLDQLSKHGHAHKLHWLPTIIPPNIHLVVSADTNSQVFAHLRVKVPESGTFMEVGRLSRDEGAEILDAELRAWNRALTAEQRDVVLQSFDHQGSPLHLKLLLTEAKRWSSYTPVGGLCLGSNLQEVMSQLFLSLEQRHGKKLVGAVLSYISLAREGLLESELLDLLSLDDDVIAEVYRFSLPPNPALIRFPSLLWAGLRMDLDGLLVEHWAGGLPLLGLQHRLSEAIKSSSSASERCEFHRKLSEYFLGRWSNKLKPVALPGLALLLANRKVPPQPLWFAQELANVRKLQELPYQLLQAGLEEELRLLVASDAEWLFCKVSVCGVAAVLQDLDLSCTEVRLVRDALMHLKPSVDFLDGHMDRSFFFMELLSRLSFLAPSFPLVATLCSQCEQWLLGCSEPVLIPSCSFLKSPGGALTHTFTGFQAVSCVDVSQDSDVLAAGSERGTVLIWDLENLLLLHMLQAHTAAVLSVKVIGSSSIISLAIDALRGWSLLTGQQLFSIPDAVPIDSAPSSIHLSQHGNLMFVSTRTQVRGWTLDSAPPKLAMDASGPLILGLLGDAVVTLSQGLVQVSCMGHQTTKIQLKTPEEPVHLRRSIMLPKHNRVLILTEDSLLYQVSRTGRRTVIDFPLVPSLFGVSEDERILFAAAGKMLRLYNLEWDSVDSFLDVQHQDTILSACLSRDRRLLLSGARDQIIRVWSVTTGTLLDSLCVCGMEVWVSSLVLVLSDGALVSTSPGADSIQLWSLKYDTQTTPRAHVPSGCSHLSLTRDGDRVFYIQREEYKEIICWDNITGSRSGSLALPGRPCCLELAQNKLLLFCGLTSGTILIYPLRHPQETLCIPPPDSSMPRVRGLALDPPERRLAAAYEDAICLFEVTARDSFPSVDGPFQRCPLSLLHSPVSSMALLGDSVLYGTECGEVRFHDFKSSSSRVLEGQRSRVTCVVGSNLGGHALVGSEDSVQRLWSLKPLEPEHTMDYKGVLFEGVLCAVFSESDHFLFTGSLERTVKVWDVATGSLLLVQFVYVPVVRMVTCRNGFAALTQQGCVLKEVFHRPEHVAPDYNALRSIKAQYRVTTRDRRSGSAEAAGGPGSPGGLGVSTVELQHFNPAQFNLDLLSMLSSKSSSTCTLL